MQGRGLAADVLGDLLQLVGGDVEAVAGLAALGGGVLDEQVLAGRALDGALDHLDVAADTVLLVDDEVARLERQRVDGLAAAGRHPAQFLAGGALAGQVGLGQYGQPQTGVDEAVVDRTAGDVDDRRGDLGEVRLQAGRDALAAEDLGGAGRRAVALRDVDGAPAVGQPALGVGERSRRVAPVRLRGVHAEFERVFGQLLVGGERGHRPPQHVQLAGAFPDVRDAAQRGRAHVDRGVTAARRGRPGRLQELLRGRHQVRRPGPHPLRVADQRHGALGQYVEQQLHVVHEHRGQRLHALHGDALGELAEQLAELGVGLGEGGGPLPHAVGQQQLAAGRRPQAVLGDFEGTLVGDLEVPDLLDVVAPELHAQRVLLGRREDVEDAAAHRELAALLDQFHAGVRRCRQRRRDLPQVRAPPGPQRHRLQVPQALDLRLEHGAYGRDDDAHRAGGRVVGVRVRQAAQDGEAAAHGVAARRQALVRQGLPRRVVDDPLLRQQGAQRGGQVLGLAAGRGDGEHGTPGLAGQRGHREGACGGRADQVDVHAVAVGGGLHRFGERRVSYYGIQQTVQAHEGFPSG
ncbi:hypothetical protein GCM10010353_41930 [Streptomyces chryseus]|nr:hypothetical protein GCM10010353_41930 [Streptomyces chryseus]